MELDKLIKQKKEELLSSQKVADWLNDNKYQAPKGGKFWAKTVDRFLDILIRRKPTESVRKDKVVDEPNYSLKVNNKGECRIINKEQDVTILKTEDESYARRVIKNIN
jgi:hypothetical protein